MKKAKWISLVLIAALISVISVYSINAKSYKKSKSVTINASAVTLAIDDIATLSAIMKPTNSTDKLTWTSSDNAVAEVNAYGVVTAKTAGSTVITVETSNQKTANCAVTVKGSLTKEEIEELVRSELLSEESIKKLITDNTISEEAVKKIVAENTLSEEDVKRLIEEESSEEPWTDGVEVPMVSGQTLPVLISDPNRSGLVGNIKTIKVTKRRMTTTVYKNNVTMYLPYRYDVILTADVPNVTEALKTAWYAGLNLGAPDVTAKIDATNDNYTASFVGNTLTELVTFYSVYDIDEFFIGSAVWVSR